MTKIQKPSQGNNTPLPEISAALALQIEFLRSRFGIEGPTAKAICEIAFGALGYGSGE